uniref:Uncharacterized protein n=1 Tax=Bartonella rochalimae ATCC BAA-1498 TaxID=685782 RepID=E6YMT5_9HYPH|nr:hypothetical protein BARRO_80037 [Bartonella rochalimae ATCC BAA-1498]
MKENFYLRCNNIKFSYANIKGLMRYLIFKQASKNKADVMIKIVFQFR